MRVLRIAATVLALAAVWVFRRRRGALLVGMVAGLLLRRMWVTGPSRAGTLGRAGGPPRWVRAASGRVVATGALGRVQRRHTGSLFDARPARRWW